MPAGNGSVVRGRVLRSSAGSTAGKGLSVRFFFYGTLLAGADNEASPAVHAGLGPGRPATIGGRLFALPDPAGWYPALIADPRGSAVHGELYRALPSFAAADLAAMDAWEECADDGTGEYRRELLPVTSEGYEFLAQVYVYNAALPADAVPVPGGDFAAFLTACGLPAYR